MSHVVIYIPGLGDRKVGGRRLLVAGWRIYGVRPVVHQINWSDGQPFAPKLLRLLEHIDAVAGQGHTVSLVGESAGASAAINAYAARPGSVHRVACICGKLRGAESIHPHTYRTNPAFAESMAILPSSLASLQAQELSRIRSVHPLRDDTVPVEDTIIPGAESVGIPTSGHTASIILGDTLFSFRLVGFLRKR